MIYNCFKKQRPVGNFAGQFSFKSLLNKTWPSRPTYMTSQKIFI